MAKKYVKKKCNSSHEILSHSKSNGYYQKRQKLRNTGKEAEKRKFLYIFGGCKLVESLWEMEWRLPKIS
jgi:hypothetical protein